MIHDALYEAAAVLWATTIALAAATVAVTVTAWGIARMCGRSTPC